MVPERWLFLMRRGSVLTAKPVMLSIIVVAIAAAGTPGSSTSDKLSSAGKLAQQRIADVTKGIQGQSGGCINGPDCDDEDNQREAGPSSTQAETSIAVDITGQHIVVAFNDFRGFPTNPATQGTSIS